MYQHDPEADRPFPEDLAAEHEHRLLAGRLESQDLLDLLVGNPDAHISVDDLHR
jgi:hypothetical protein